MKKQTVKKDGEDGDGEEASLSLAMVSQATPQGRQTR